MKEDVDHWQTAKEYKSDQAATLASLYSINRDLEFTIYATKLILQIPSDQPKTDEDIDNYKDQEMLRAGLWNAAVISYIRTFSSGVRDASLSIEMFNKLGDRADDAQKAHAYFKNMRDKHIAHSVNRFEDVKIALLVGDGVHSQKGVIGLAPLLMSEAGQEKDTIQTLQNLATFLKKQVNILMDEKVPKVLEEAKKLSDNELASLPNLEFRVPIEIEEAGKRRH